MTRTLAGLFVVALACSWASATGNVNFVIGARHLDDDTWDKVQNQVSGSIAVDFSPEDWPVHFVFGAAGSGRDENGESWRWWDRTTDYGRVGELSFGAVLLPNRKSQTRPFIGAGVAKTFSRVGHKVNGEWIEESDNAVGVYLNAGVYWRLGEKFNIGLDARVLRGATGTLFGVEQSANYKQIGLLLGFGF
jgi:hypothetical protein